jgi:DNA-binding GntR family transcriptional regulator
LWVAAARYTRLVFDPQDIAGPNDRAHRQRAHQDLLDPVRAGDPDAAAASLHNHLTNNLTVIRSLVDKALNLNGTG